MNSVNQKHPGRIRAAILSIAVTVVVAIAIRWCAKPRPSYEIQLPKFVYMEDHKVLNNRWLKFSQTIGNSEASDLAYADVITDNEWKHIDASSRDYDHNVVYFVDHETQQVSTHFCFEAGRIYNSGMLPNGDFVAISLCSDNKLRIDHFDTKTGKIRKQVRRLQGKVGRTNLAISKDFSTLALAYSSNEEPLQIEIINVPDGTLRTTLRFDRKGCALSAMPEPLQAFSDWSFSDDGTKLTLTDAWDGITNVTNHGFAIYDTHSGQQVFKLDEIPSVPRIPPNTKFHFKLSQTPGIMMMRLMPSSKAKILVGHRWVSDQHTNWAEPEWFDVDLKTSSITKSEHVSETSDTLSSTTTHHLEVGINEYDYPNGMLRVTTRNGDVVRDWIPTPRGVYGQDVELVEGTTGMVALRQMEPGRLKTWGQQAIDWLNLDWEIHESVCEGLWIDWKDKTIARFRDHDIVSAFAFLDRIGVLRTSNERHVLEVWDAPPRIWNRWLYRIGNVAIFVMVYWGLRRRSRSGIRQA